MLNAFFVILLIIACELVSLVIYAIYHLITIRLVEAGKITRQINRRIIWTIFGLPIVAGILVFYLVESYRPPNKERLEAISDITLPSDFTILDNEYVNWQGYHANYKIRFKDKLTTSELIRSITKSKFYNSNLVINKPQRGIYSYAENTEWRKTVTGFYFQKNFRHTRYSIEVDTIHNTLCFEELGN